MEHCGNERIQWELVWGTDLAATTNYCQRILLHIIFLINHFVYITLYSSCSKTKREKATHV